MLTLDRILGSELQGQRALILVDVEGAELAMLQGATNILQSEPHPIWMMEIGSTTHQPSGIEVNPNLVATFQRFFEQGYTAETADERKVAVDFELVSAVAEGWQSFGTHNFLFR